MLREAPSQRPRRPSEGGTWLVDNVRWPRRWTGQVQALTPELVAELLCAPPPPPPPGRGGPSPPPRPGSRVRWATCPPAVQGSPGPAPPGSRTSWGCRHIPLPRHAQLLVRRVRFTRPSFCKARHTFSRKIRSLLCPQWLCSRQIIESADWRDHCGQGRENTRSEA